MNTRSVDVSSFGSLQVKTWCAVAMSAALYTITAIPSHGAVISWTDGDQEDFWNDGIAWSTGTVPLSGDTALFNASNSVNGESFVVLVAAPSAVGSILFDADAYASSPGGTGYDINGSAITLSSSGTIGILSSFSGLEITETVDDPLTLLGNATFNNDAVGNTLYLTGNITAPGVTSQITVSGSAGGTISGVISDSGTSTPISVTKTGPGTWTLSGNENYSGVTTVNGGALIMPGSSTLGGGIAVNGATAIFAGNNNLGSGGIAVTGGIATFSGSNTLSGGLSVTGGGTLTMNGANTISGGNITVANSTLDLAGNYSGGGNITVTNGALDFAGSYSGAGTLTLNGGSATLGGQVSTSGNINLEGGTLTLSAGNDNYTGSIVATSGTLMVNNWQDFGDPNHTNYFSGGATISMMSSFGYINYNTMQLGAGGVVFDGMGGINFQGWLEGGGGFMLNSGDFELNNAWVTQNIGTLTINGGRFLIGGWTSNVLANNPNANNIALPQQFGFWRRRQLLGRQYHEHCQRRRADRARQLDDCHAEHRQRNLPLAGDVDHRRGRRGWRFLHDQWDLADPDRHPDNIHSPCG